MTLGAVILAALAGSMHCGAMCGAFAATCGSRPASGIAYHLGRLTAYVALGTVAGALGAGVDALAANLLGIQRIAAVLMGITLIVLAIRLARPRREAPLVQIGEPGARRSTHWLARALRQRTARGALSVGLLSGLLPCGWLWGFVALAASRGSAVDGALVMGAFWIGTVPLLLAIGGLAGRITERLKAWARPAIATGLFLAGALSITGHWLPMLDDPAATAADLKCP